jgi:plastocyanin
MRAIRKLRFAAGVALLVLAACGRVPESTEQARGILRGPNVVLALSVLFIVLAVGLIVVAVAADRFIRNRRALAEEPPPEEPEVEEADEVVAGITLGRAPVPRWLYAAYVLIPLFAFAYVFSNVAPPPAAEEAEETAAPTGPCTECTIVASGIEFETDTLTMPAETEVTVTLDNQDTAVPHDWSAWESKAAADANDEGAKLGATAQFPGAASRDVTFETPEAGTYYFNCTVHPTSMFGDLEVVAG